MQRDENSLELRDKPRHKLCLGSAVSHQVLATQANVGLKGLLSVNPDSLGKKSKTLATLHKIFSKFTELAKA